MAGLNGVGVLVIDPGIGDAELFQQPVAARLPRDALVQGLSGVDGGINIHGNSLFQKLK